MNETKNNLELEDLLLSFMEDIDKCKEELSSLEEKYEVLLNEQEEGALKLNNFSSLINSEELA